MYVEGLGTYRVLVTRDSVSSDAVLTGVSLADDEALIGRQMIIEVLAGGQRCSSGGGGLLWLGV